MPQLPLHNPFHPCHVWACLKQELGKGHVATFLAITGLLADRSSDEEAGEGRRVLATTMALLGKELFLASSHMNPL